MEKGIDTESTKDQDLLAAAGNGSAGAFQNLYDRYSAKVFNTAIGYLQNEHDAEEVVQDVFIKIHKNANKFNGLSAVNTWIYRITINTSLDHLKKRKRNSFLIFGEDVKESPTYVHPGVLLENKEASIALFKVIHTLKGNQKTAFILSFIELLPRQEVADIMGLKLKAIESLLQRAKNNIKPQLIKMTQK